MHFCGGPLDGVKIVGFAVWTRANGLRHITMPGAGRFKASGVASHTVMTRLSFMQPIGTDMTSFHGLSRAILESYRMYEQEQGATTGPRTGAV